MSEEGFGKYVDKETMSRDLTLPPRNCFCAFVKNDIRLLDEEFFNAVKDRECTSEVYSQNYDKPIDDLMKKIAMKYSLNKELLQLSPCDTQTESKFTFISFESIQYINSTLTSALKTVRTYCISIE